VQTKPLLSYPKHPEFEELLNSCGSMTRQLEDLGHKLSVTLLAECSENNNFRRYTTLNLNNTPVVVACSQTLIKNQFFYNLLKNASTTPIGKFLFSNNQVRRLENMKIELVNQKHFQQHKIIINNIILHKYRLDQTFWQRTSIFRHSKNEQFELIEILLPELELFFGK